MDVLYSRCWGIDIHKKSITVCVLIREARGEKKRSGSGSSAPRRQRF